MITGFFINMFGQMFDWFITLLPLDNGLPTGIATSITQFALYLHTYDYFFPVATFLSLAILAISVELVFFAANFISYLIRLAAEIIP